jgi:hypothetical protein
MTAAEIAAALGGAHRSGAWWRSRCPAHGSRGATLALFDGTRGLVVHCHGGCTQSDILAELLRLGLFGGKDDAYEHRPDPEQIRRRREAEAADRRERTALALDMWGESGPGHDTAVEQYLHARGITIPIPATVRFLSMYGSYGRHPSSAHRPQMIALVEHVGFGPVAVSRTFLAPDGGGKASVSPVRIFTGPVGGGAVRLAPIRPDRPLALGEGIETTLSVMQACHLPGWAALSAVGIEKLILPPEARTLLICADHDANGAGERAARRAAKRFISEGRRVRLAVPPQGLDFNDLLMGRASRIDEHAI